MSFNGSGTFVINTAGQPVVSGTVISSTAFNALTADLATGLSTCITKDGQTTPTANIPMGNNKITGLAVGTAATDAATLSQVQSTAAKLIGSVSGADTITGTLSPTLGAYAAGQMFYFVAAGTNTGAVTINIDGLGAKAVTRDGSTALTAGDLRSGEVIVIVYDGTRFQVVSQVNSGGDATFANVSITSALNVGGVATFTGNPVLSGGTANGVLYLNASKVATSGSALVFDGTNLGVGVTPSGWAGGYKAINIVGSGSMFSNNQYNTRIGNNLYHNGTNFIYNANGTATYYSQNDAVGSHTWHTAPSGTAGGTITFTQAMTLDASGNLGIGTSSPGARLEVSGSLTTTANVSGLLTLGRYDAGTPWSLIRPSSDSSGFEFRSFGGTAWMNINSSGNLGLGVTPSAWSASWKALQVNAQTSLFAGSSTAYLGVNIFSDGTNKYIGTGEATLYEQASGAHKWYTAPSGTAGNAITFTQAMTLDASGRLGVGTASPTQRLHLVGSGDTMMLVNDGTYNSFFGTISSQTRVSNDNAIPIVFATNSTERARITSGGSFLIQTTDAGTTSGIGHKFIPDAAQPYISTVGSSTSNDNVSYSLYSTGASAYRFYVGYGGTVYATNTTISGLSDKRVKENIVDLDVGLDAVMALKPRKFDWKEGKGKDIKNDRGFIAQEFEQVFPDLIDEWKDPAPEGEEPYKSVRQDLIPVLVKAIQELKAELDVAKVKIAALETK